MDGNHPLSKASDGLLASDSEDEELHISTRREMTNRRSIAVALTVVNAAVLLASAVFWFSVPGRGQYLPRLAGAGDVQDALDADAIKYEIRSYSKPLEYDEVSKKAVIFSSGDRNFAGPPSLEIDAAWNDLLRGELLAISSCPRQTRDPALKLIPSRSIY